MCSPAASARWATVRGRVSARPPPGEPSASARFSQTSLHPHVAGRDARGGSELPPSTTLPFSPTDPSRACDRDPRLRGVFAGAPVSISPHSSPANHPAVVCITHHRRLGQPARRATDSKLTPLNSERVHRRDPYQAPCHCLPNPIFSLFPVAPARISGAAIAGRVSCAPSAASLRFPAPVIERGEGPPWAPSFDRRETTRFAVTPV